MSSSKTVEFEQDRKTGEIEMRTDLRREIETLKKRRQNAESNRTETEQMKRLRRNLDGTQTKRKRRRVILRAGMAAGAFVFSTVLILFLLFVVGPYIPIFIS